MDTSSATNQQQEPSLWTINHPVLPRNTICDYLAEGAANIVYRVDARPDTPVASVAEEYGEGTPPPEDFNPWACPVPDIWQGKLLRLRKDLPTTDTSIVAHDKFLQYIAPLFSTEDIIEQRLVEIKQSGIIEKLNQELYNWEHIPAGFKGSLRASDYRPVARHGIYLADDDHALLIEDMSPGIGEEIVQFKPKWLVQSPNAPVNSKRCRTCALRARRNAENIAKGLKPVVTYCPLDLVSSKDEEMYRAAKILTRCRTPEILSQQQYKKLWRFCEWAKTTPILSRLRTLQEHYDPKGVLVADPHDKSMDLMTAMTLRDVTIFLRFPVDTNAPLTAKMADLDLKSPIKADGWKQVEAELIVEGWYDGTEARDKMQPLSCALYPETWMPVSWREARQKEEEERRANEGPGIFEDVD